MAKKSKFKKFIKGVDKYYRATKEGLAAGGRGLKEGYQSFTGAAKENLEYLNQSGFVQDARRGIRNAIPYMESKFRKRIWSTTMLLGLSDYSYNNLKNLAKIKVDAFNARNNKNAVFIKLNPKTRSSIIYIGFEYPITKEQADRAMMMMEFNY